MMAFHQVHRVLGMASPATASAAAAAAGSTQQPRKRPHAEDDGL